MSPAKKATPLPKKQCEEITGWNRIKNEPQFCKINSSSSVGGKCYCKRHADIAKARRLNGIETEFRERKSRMIEALVDHPETGLSPQLLDARTMYLAAKADYDEARAGGAGK